MKKTIKTIAFIRLSLGKLVWVSLGLLWIYEGLFSPNSSGFGWILAVIVMVGLVVVDMALFNTTYDYRYLVVALLGFGWRLYWSYRSLALPIGVSWLLIPLVILMIALFLGERE